MGDQQEPRATGRLVSGPPAGAPSVSGPPGGSPPVSGSPASGQDPTELEPATLPPPGSPQYPAEPPPPPPPSQPYLAGPQYPPGALGQAYVPGQPWQGYPYAWQRQTNGLAIASLVVSIVAVPAACVCYGVPGLLLGPTGAIMGHVARNQIRANHQDGDGLALSGMIVGWVMTGLSLLAIVAIIATMVLTIQTDTSTTP